MFSFLKSKLPNIPAPIVLPPGSRIESFELLQSLGQGGFGITYEAVDLQLGARVAIKELFPESIAIRMANSTVVVLAESDIDQWQWAKERFMEEAKMLALMQHPNIVDVHRLIETNSTLYMVMDFVDGENYGSLLKRYGAETLEDHLMAIIRPLLLGLHEVHEAGLLHRDIKPENIIVSKNGTPILIDFGSARERVNRSVSATSIVTHGYSPIEQYQTQDRMGPWTDIYAVGAVMCRAIVGKKPPVATNRIMADDFQWLSRRNLPGFSARILKAIDWALRVKPDDRPQTIAQWVKTFW